MKRNELDAKAETDSQLFWIRKNKIRNEKGKVITCGPGSSHFFLEDIYADDKQKIVIRKPSQAGVSLWAITRGIHHGIKWGINVIHTLPTVADVGKFVPAKVNELIRANPKIKSGIEEKEVDAITQKQFGKGFVYYRGTKSEREALMITSDENIYDEYDKSDMAQVANYRSRQEGEESMKKEVWLSTPTVPNFGIDDKYAESDQKHWRFNCQECGYEQHMIWPDNVDMENERYICQKCGKPLAEEVIRSYDEDINPKGTGRWKAKFPGREMSGYWITQMIFPWKWVGCGNLIKEYKECEKKGTLDYFYNHKLGLPYVSAESQISASLIYRNLSQRDHVEVNCLMGVDVQLHELYVMLGTTEGIFGILIVRNEYDEEGRITKSKWDRLAELMDAYDVRIAVIDGGFTPNEVVDFAKRFPHKVYVNWYKDDPKKEKIMRFADEDFQGKTPESLEEEIKVLTERDRMIDLVLANLRGGEILFFYRPEDEAIKRLVSHVGTTYARMVTDRKGLTTREWVHTGKDDFLHALIYWRIALEKSRYAE